MSISKQIQELQLSKFNETKKNPKELFLGIIEAKELNKENSKLLIIYKKSKFDWYYGMRVIYTDSESQLEIK